MSKFTGRTRADKVFEVATIPLGGPKYVLWWLVVFVGKVILEDDGPATRPTKVVVRYKDDGTVFYQYGKYSDAYGPIDAVQVLTESLHKQTVEEFCRDRSLTEPSYPSGKPG